MIRGLGFLVLALVVCAESGTLTTTVAKHRAPRTDVPRTDVPRTDVPRTDVPRTDAPSTGAPSTDAPSTGAPSTDAPSTRHPAPSTLDPLPPLRSVVYVTGLTNPVAFVQDPADTTIQFVVQQGGLIRVIQNGVLQSTPFLNLTTVVSKGGEQGLLGMALAPDYASSRRFYVNFTNTDGHIVVARFLRDAANPLVADAASRFDLRWSSGLRYILHPTFANHNGGDLHFAQDGYLYMSVGDGGGGGDTSNNAQNPNTLLGKILRIDVNVDDSNVNGYVVPPDNPFVDGNPIAAMGEIWSFGWRNPWRFSFDDPALGGTGAMLVGDVGQNAREEIDYEPPATGGRNYGWRNYEGTLVFNNSVAPSYGPLIPPLLDYDRSVGTTVIGGVVNRRSLGSPGGYVGRYFYADFSGRVWSTQLTPGPSGEMTPSNTLEHTAELGGGAARPGLISAFGVDWQGAIHIVDWGGGRILRIEAATLQRRGARFARIDFDGDNTPDLAYYLPAATEFQIRGVTTSITPLAFGQPGDIPVPGYYSSVASTTQLAVFRPSTGFWHIAGQAPVFWGAPGDIPIPGRYRLAAFDDVAVFRPSTGEWFIKDFLYTRWGLAGDIPVPADYDGDGRDDVAVFRPSNGVWYVQGHADYVLWGQPGDIPVPADFDGDGVTDFAVFRPYTGQWLVRGKLQQVWGAPGDIPVPMDFDHDFRAELVVYRPSTEVWHIHNIVTGEIQAIHWGETGGVVPLGRRAIVPTVTGDVDGDRRADFTIFRASSAGWLSAFSSTGYQTYFSTAFGMNSDTPLMGDFDGDGRQDVTLFRPAASKWYSLLSSTAFSQYITDDWGVSGDIAVPGDYDGDGRSNVAVFRPSQGRWYLRNQFGGPWIEDYGQPGDLPAPADYNGDGLIEFAVFRPGEGRWYLRGSANTGTERIVTWGLAGDIAVPADYDGDRRADVAVFRPSQGRWYVLLSASNASLVVDWGLSGDQPMPADYDGDGRVDIAVYRPSTGRWYVRGLVTKDWGLPGDVPVQGAR